MNNDRFPDNFILGTGTSAFQIEGEGKTEWSGFTGEDGTRLGTAIDHYRRFEEDLEYILYLGNAYRFSPDWSKLQDKPFGNLDSGALKHYEKLLKVLKDNNKKVLMVFNHFSNPLWMFDSGGWPNKNSVTFYLDYAKKILEAFSDYIDLVNTFNEPNAYVNLAYLLRRFPPKRISFALRKRALANMSEAHCSLYDYIKEKYPEIKVGISQAHMIFEEPENRSTFTGRVLKNFIDSIQHEKVHEFFTKNSEKVDFIGFSYYGRILLENYGLLAYQEKGRKKLDELGIQHDDMWELYPEGLYRMLKFFYEKYKKPLLITENGTCTNDDTLRKQSLYNHLSYLKKASDEGLPVLGYFHWSTFDNFELDYGPSRRFGLTSVDFNSPGLERKIKDSGHYYHQVVQSNSLIKP
jgi:beta-glucosidase